MSHYIVASCKAWHLESFEHFTRNDTGSWQYVSSREELDDALTLASPCYIFFLHWNWLVPSNIWEKYECVCFHMTDVPYGRGGSPLQNLIIAGKAETMVSALRMVEEMDAGPVYAKRPMRLDGRAEDVYMRVGQRCWEMIKWIVATEPMPEPQQGEVTIFKRRKPEQSILPLNGGLTQIYDHVRMLDAPSYPLAFIQYGEFRLEFSNAELKGEELHAHVVFLKT